MMIIRLVIFLILNFGALAIGGFFTGDGVISDWYVNLNKAPWTPPGWVFGAAWTTIMLCFSLYMALAWERVADKSKLIGLYVIQLVLNIAWNPIFFKFHYIGLAMLTISALTLLVTYFLFKYRFNLKYMPLLVLPYFIWLLIACTLNAYALIYN